MSNRIHVWENGNLMLGDHGMHDFPRVSWAQYFVDLGAKTKKDLAQHAWEWDIDDVDTLIDDYNWSGVYEMHYDPMPAAYHFLKRYKIGAKLRSKAKTAGRLDFFAGSNHPGSNDLWVEAYDDLTVSLLQARLIELKKPIEVVMEVGSVRKEWEHYGDEPWDE